MALKRILKQVWADHVANDIAEYAIILAILLVIGIAVMRSI